MLGSPICWSSQYDMLVAVDKLTGGVEAAAVTRGLQQDVSTAHHVPGLLASMLRAAVEDGYVAGARPSGPRRGGARGRRCGR